MLATGAFSVALVLFIHLVPTLRSLVEIETCNFDWPYFFLSLFLNLVGTISKELNSDNIWWCIGSEKVIPEYSTWPIIYLQILWRIKSVSAVGCCWYWSSLAHPWIRPLAAESEEAESKPSLTDHLIVISLRVTACGKYPWIRPLAAESGQSLAKSSLSGKTDHLVVKYKRGWCDKCLSVQYTIYSVLYLKKFYDNEAKG